MWLKANNFLRDIKGKITSLCKYFQLQAKLDFLVNTHGFCGQSSYIVVCNEANKEVQCHN